MSNFSTVLTDYLGIGVAASRPTSPNVATGCAAFFFATDTSSLFTWTGSAWVAVTSAPGADVTGPVSSTAGHVALWNNTAGTLLKDSANLDGIILGATTPAAGTFTTLAATGEITATAAGTGLAVTNNATVGGTLGVTGASTLSGAVTAGAAGTGLAVTNNATVGGALAVTGVATVGAASAGAQAVQYQQVVNTIPIGSSTAVTATSVASTTGTFTAPSAGLLVMLADGQSASLNVSAVSLATSLAGIVNLIAEGDGALGTALSYLPMTAGQTTTITGTLVVTASASISVIVRAFFLPLA